MVVEKDAFASYAVSLFRIVLALAFLQHGTHKLFGFPPGPGFIGFDLTALEGWAGLIELTNGVLILLGLFTRWAAFVASGEMAVAYWTVHAPLSAFPAVNDGESAYLFCFAFLLLVFIGPGDFRSDGYVGKNYPLVSNVRMSRDSQNGAPDLGGPCRPHLCGSRD